MKTQREKIGQLLKLLENLPLHHYAARGAKERLVDRGVDEKMAADIIEVGMSLPGDSASYDYGEGILLRRHHRDRLIRCLRAIVSTKKGRPEKHEDDLLEQASKDLREFESELAKIQATGIKKGAKTRACEVLEKKWNLTNRRVRARVSQALKLAGLPF